MNWSKSWEDTASGSIPEILGVKEREEFIAGVRKIGTFRIKDGQSYHTFVGEVVGDLALDYSDDGWNIYHMPTLTKFTSAVPSSGIKEETIDCASCKGAGCFNCDDNGFIEVSEEIFEYEKSALLRWMAKIQTNYPTSWQMLALLTPTDYEDKAVRAKEIIKEWCLSVKVE